MEAHLVAAHGLQQGEGAHQVRLDERRGVQQRVVVVGLRGEVDDRIGSGHDAVDQIASAMSPSTTVRRDASSAGTSVRDARLPA